MAYLGFMFTCRNIRYAFKVYDLIESENFCLNANFYRIKKFIFRKIFSVKGGGIIKLFIIAKRQL